MRPLFQYCILLACISVMTSCSREEARLRKLDESVWTQDAVLFKGDSIEKANANKQMVFEVGMPGDGMGFFYNNGKSNYFFYEFDDKGKTLLIEDMYGVRKYRVIKLSNNKMLSGSAIKRHLVLGWGEYEYHFSIPSS